MWRCLCFEPNTYPFECDKDCEIGKDLEECECMKSLVDDVAITCDNIEDTPVSASISLSME